MAFNVCDVNPVNQNLSCAPRAHCRETKTRKNVSVICLSVV